MCALVSCGASARPAAWSGRLQSGLVAEWNHRFTCDSGDSGNSAERAHPEHCGNMEQFYACVCG